MKRLGKLLSMGKKEGQFRTIDGRVVFMGGPGSGGGGVSGGAGSLKTRKAVEDFLGNSAVGNEMDKGFIEVVNKSEVTVSVFDEDGDPDYDSTEELAGRVMKVLGWEGSYSLSGGETVYVTPYQK